MGEAAEAVPGTTIMNDAVDDTMLPSVFFANSPFNSLPVNIRNSYIRIYGDISEHPAIILFRALVILDISVIATQQYGECVQKFIEYFHNDNFRHVFNNSNVIHIFVSSNLNTDHISRLKRFCQTLNIFLTPEVKIELNHSITAFVSTCMLYYRRFYEGSSDLDSSSDDTLSALRGLLNISKTSEVSSRVKGGVSKIPKSQPRVNYKPDIVNKISYRKPCHFEYKQEGCKNFNPEHQTLFKHRCNYDKMLRGCNDYSEKHRNEMLHKGTNGKLHGGKRRIVTKKRNIRSRMNRRSRHSTTNRRRH
jgi:hypothetical protein